MTPPPSSAAASFCDSAAILPSLYLATARVLPRPAVASRLVDAPDAAPPRPAIAPAVAPDAAPPRPAVALAIVLPLPFRCYRAAVGPPGGCPAKPSRSAAIALCRRAAPRLALSHSAVAPRLALPSRQKSCCKTSSILVLPCPAWPSPCPLPSPCRHPAIGPAQPSSRYRLAAICPAVTLLPSPGCRRLARPPRPAIKCRRALLPCRCGSALLLLTYLAASTHIPSSPVHLHGC